MSGHKMPKAWIEWEVRDTNGRLIAKGKRRSHTWVANALRFIASIFSFWGTTTTGGYYAATRTETVDVGGTARPLLLGSHVNTVTYGGAAPPGETSAGIVIGTSDTPVSPGQYNLGSPIAHGTGAGQMLYGNTTVETVTVTTTGAIFRIIRTFTNNSGASIIVREMGLFFKFQMPSSPFWYSAMLARDVFPSPVTVPDGSTLTVRYIISITVS